MNQPTDHIHRIRLKGPWEASRLHESTGQTPFERIHVPISWREAFDDFSGSVCFKRKFHEPSGLKLEDRVRIRIPNGTGSLTDFQINGIAITPDKSDSLLFDITNHLDEFSEIQFVVSFAPQETPDIPGGLWEAVYLEIASGE